MTEVNVLLVGDGGAGKTSLCIQFVQNCFYEEYDPTLGTKPPRHPP